MTWSAAERVNRMGLPADPLLVELVRTEGLVEHIDDELEAAGMLGRPGRVPAMGSWTW